jgi:hypothetical protein
MSGMLLANHILMKGIIYESDLKAEGGLSDADWIFVDTDSAEENSVPEFPWNAQLENCNGIVNCRDETNAPVSGIDAGHSIEGDRAVTPDTTADEILQSLNLANSLALYGESLYLTVFNMMESDKKYTLIDTDDPPQTVPLATEHLFLHNSETNLSGFSAEDKISSCMVDLFKDLFWNLQDDSLASIMDSLSVHLEESSENTLQRSSCNENSFFGSFVV